MKLPRWVVWASAATMTLATGVVSGQSFPARAVSLITSEAGGALDFNLDEPVSSALYSGEDPDDFRKCRDFTVDSHTSPRRSTHACPMASCP